MIKKVGILLAVGAFLFAPLMHVSNVAAQTRYPGNYVALGDSVASGRGLSGSGADQLCYRSNNAYPNLVAKSMNYNLTNVGCSGATVGDLYTQQRLKNGLQPPQIQAAFSRGVPDVITITAGANDMQWGQFLRKCYLQTCGTSLDTATANALRFNLERKYKDALEQIRLQSGSKLPIVVATGYYNPISNECLNKFKNVSDQEIAWLNAQRDVINDSIRSVLSTYPNAKYASANFANHSMSAKDSWIQPVNGSAPFHPNSRGHQEIARSITKVLQDMSVSKLTVR